MTIIKPTTLHQGEIVEEIIAERQRQDRKWGGAAHDDEHERSDFVRFVREHLDAARKEAMCGRLDEWRVEMIQIAALAVAAVEMSDRRRDGYP